MVVLIAVTQEVVAQAVVLVEAMDVLIKKLSKMNSNQAFLDSML